MREGSFRPGWKTPHYQTLSHFYVHTHTHTQTITPPPPSSPCVSIATALSGRRWCKLLISSGLCCLCHPVINLGLFISLLLFPLSSLPPPLSPWFFLSPSLSFSLLFSL